MIIYTTINFTRLSVVSVTVGVVKTCLAAAMLSGISAHVYTAHRGWLGVVTGISAASTGGILVIIECRFPKQICIAKYRQSNGVC